MPRREGTAPASRENTFLANSQDVEKRVKSSATEAVAEYQLVVINSCLTNDDIRLPRTPTSAMLASFYAQWVEPPSRATSSTPRKCGYWSGTHWLRHVAHVPLGRHSALPAAYQLHHDCISRLHARVVYVRTLGMHKHLAKVFPHIVRDSHVCPINDGADTDSAGDDVAVRFVKAGRATCTEPPVPLPFATPYFLLINHSFNCVFVGSRAVPCGRSIVLESGDVVSFLECAFDAEGGVLDHPVGPLLCNPDVEGEGFEECGIAAARDGMAEPSCQLAHAALRQFLPAFSGACNSSDRAFPPVFPVCVSRRLIAFRRLYEATSLVQGFVRWWDVHTRGSVDLSPPPHTSPSSACAAWLVASDQTVRASSSVVQVDADRSAAPPVVKAAQVGEPRLWQLPRKRCRTPSVQPHCDTCHKDTDLWRCPAFAASLRRWLDDTEELREEADNAPSPLAARLVLERAWLRRATQALHSPQPQKRSISLRVAEGPRDVKAESASSSIVWKCEASAFDTDASTSEAHAVAERFRVSPSPHHDLSSASRSVTTPQPLSERSSVQLVLEELRCRCSSAKNLKANANGEEGNLNGDLSRTQTPMRRLIRLDADPIDAFLTRDTRAESVGLFHQTACSTQETHASPTSDLETFIPAVRLHTAALPVYVFSRRSLSPDVNTRERASPRHKSAAAANAAQYVYYFDPEEPHAAVSEPSSSSFAPSELPAVPGAEEKQPCENGDCRRVEGGTDLVWIDETVKISRARGRGRRRGRRGTKPR